MKTNPFIQYISKITFFSIAVCFVVMLLWLKVPADYIRNTPYYIIMYYVVTILCYAFLYFTQKKATIRFENAYMLTKIIKFLIYIAVLALVLLFNIEKNIKFAIAYLSLFVIYQVFDTITLMRLVKQINNKNK